MAQVFGDACRRADCRGGLGTMAWLWARTSLDLTRTTVEQHIERGIDMSRDKFVRWSGWALIAGAMLLSAGLTIGDFDSNWSDALGGVDGLYEIGQIAGLLVGHVLLVTRLLGLRAGFAHRSVGLGSLALVITLAGEGPSLWPGCWLWTGPRPAGQPGGSDS